MSEENFLDYITFENHMEHNDQLKHNSKSLSIKLHPDMYNKIVHICKKRNIPRDMYLTMLINHYWECTESGE